MNIDDLEVKHIDGATFDWHEPTIDIYNKETMHKILQNIIDNTHEDANCSEDKDGEKRENK